METIRWISLIIIMLGLFIFTFLGLSIKIVRQYERSVVLLLILEIPFRPSERGPESKGTYPTSNGGIG